MSAGSLIGKLPIMNNSIENKYFTLNLLEETKNTIWKMVKKI